MFAGLAQRTIRSRNFMLKLPHGLSFPDLYTRDGLLRIDAAFLSALARADDALCQQLRAAREQAAVLTNKQESELLIALAPHLDDFIARLVRHRARKCGALSARHHELAPLYRVQAAVRAAQGDAQIKAEAARRNRRSRAAQRNLSALIGGEFSRARVRAARRRAGSADEAANAPSSTLRCTTRRGRRRRRQGKAAHRAGVLFKAPHKLDYHAPRAAGRRRQPRATPHSALTRSTCAAAKASS